MNEAEFDAVLAEVRVLAESAPYVFDSHFGRLSETEPYRRLVSFGPAALERCVAALRDGHLFLLPAVLEITGVPAADLAGGAFPSEQEVAKTFIQLWDASTAVQFEANASSAGGSTMIAAVRGYVCVSAQPQAGVSSLVQQVAPEFLIAELARQESKRKRTRDLPGELPR